MSLSTPPSLASASLDTAPADLGPPARESLLLGVNLLPASPQILARLDPLLANLESSVDDITELLRRDAALTARIIRIANSVMYNRGEPLASIEAALMRIGFSEVYRVTGFAVLAQVANQQIPLYDITGTQFRENSLLTALIMESLARRSGVESRSAYTAGLLRSTGKIALDRAMRGTNRYNDIQPFARGALTEWEQSTFACTSAQAAALVLEAWRFPAEMIEAVRDHCAVGESAGQLTRLLNLAAGSAERCGHGLPGEYPYWDNSELKCEAAGLAEGLLDDATREALEAFGPIRGAVA